MRGFVFRDEEERLVLLTVDDDFKVEEGYVGESNDQFVELCPNQAAVVDVNMYEEQGLVETLILHVLSFRNSHAPCVAREALRASLNDPSKLYAVLHDDEGIENPGPEEEPG